MLVMPVVANPEVVDIYLDGYHELATLLDHSEGDSRITRGVQSSLDSQYGDEMYRVRLTMPLLDMVEFNLVDTLKATIASPTVASVFEQYGQLPPETQRCVSLLGRISQCKEAMAVN
jgi:hypothetical protein